VLALVPPFPPEHPERATWVDAHLGASDSVQVTRHVDNCAWAFSQRLIDDIGLPDGAFPGAGWGANLDYCYRAREAGWLVVAARGSFISHRHRATYGRIDPDYAANAERHRAPVWANTYYMGLPCQKYPADMWMYQELLFRCRPDLVIETGSLVGASALALAHMLDALGTGTIISVDIDDRERPTHPRIRWLYGDSTSAGVGLELTQAKRAVERCMVILDSDHSEQHVRAELELLAPLVTTGQYLIVEDTNLNGHPVWPEWGPGPYEAVQGFLQGHPEFTVDRGCEKFLATANPGGYLLRG
jgi:cephalosporin hydroxylase